LEGKYSQIRSAGLGLAAISYDSPEVLKHFSDRMHIEFPLLSDHNSEIIKRFGILNTHVEKGTSSYGIPNPGIYLLDSSGHVKAKYFEDDFRQRDTAGMILLQQFGLASETQNAFIPAKHLQLSASATDSYPRMGQHLALVLEGRLPPTFHVYAPGVKGYIAIDWQTPATSAFKVGAVTYPASTLMRLEAIRETVPVYTNHFRLVRNIVLGSDKDVTPLLDKDGSLIVAGTFRYQACDEEKCFIPETVPVRMTLHFQTADRTRVPEDLQRKPDF
jgi:hypothetical protein